MAFGLAGWALAALYAHRERLARRTLDTFMLQSAALNTKVEELIENVYRVKLSCPLCEWTDTVVRENRPAAIEAGNERIILHNLEAGHQLSGHPRTGYYRGEPIN